jgi:hypothetical protein
MFYASRRKRYVRITRHQHTEGVSHTAGTGANDRHQSGVIRIFHCRGAADSRLGR